MLATATMSSQLAEGTRWEAPYALRMLITDAVVVAGAIFFAQYVRFGQAPLIVDLIDSRLTVWSLVFILLWMSALGIFRTRTPRVIGGGIDEYRGVVSASFWTFGVIAIACASSQDGFLPWVPGRRVADRDSWVTAEPPAVAEANLP